MTLSEKWEQEADRGGASEAALRNGNNIADSSRRFGSELPRVELFKYCEADAGEQMEFRLIYHGPLRAEKWSYGEPYARAVDKHRVRKNFHLQLRELWNQHPDLRIQAAARFRVQPGGVADKVMSLDAEGRTLLEHIANENIRCNGNRFVPLVSNTNGFTCSLNILFLRRDNPGGLVTHGGDIDSRVKVLLDGLRMPVDVKELGGLPIEADENPFYCLLEDDQLVTSISVITDRLIIPQGTEEGIHDVFLVVHVTIVNPGNSKVRNDTR